MSTEPFIIKNVRIVYPNIWQKGSYQGKEDDKYSATILLDDQEQINQVDAALRAACSEKGFKHYPKGSKNCLSDGCDHSNAVFHEIPKILKVKSMGRPVILNGRTTCSSREECPIYGGCRVNIKVAPNAFEGSYGKFAAMDMITIQFAGDDEKIGGGGYSKTEALEGFDIDDDVEM